MQIDTDLFVIGGGINGIGIAADAAGRGLAVTVAERDDLASATSSASSRLIHGGLRYLEQLEFSLVSESLRERQILLNNAPHLVRPLGFILPHCPWLRPFWLIKLGMFFYEHLTFKNKLPNSRTIYQEEMPQYELKSQFKKALHYYDCSVDDSRLVCHVALLAEQHGAKILTRHKVTKITSVKNYWIINCHNSILNEDITIKAKAIINAAGPWGNDILHNAANIKPLQQTKFVKGSHIIIPKILNHNSALILQNQDQRVVFMIPYLHKYHLIGTTDIELDSLEGIDSITPEETEYLLDICNTFLKKPITKDMIINTYWGVRPLLADDNLNPSKVTRDYKIVTQYQDNLPIITVYGGKITTYRNLAENTVNKLKNYFPQLGKPWTATARLPGSELIATTLAEFTQQLRIDYPFLDTDLIHHYIRNYGTNSKVILNNVKSLDDLGIHFGSVLYQAEVEYLLKHEWVHTVEDIIWRRGKTGLSLTNSEVETLSQWLQEYAESKRT